jgi:hypothetical protein
MTLLQTTTISTMATATTALKANGDPANYAKGWGVNSAGDWWHIGDFPGTISELVRTADGFLLGHSGEHPQ